MYEVQREIVIRNRKKPDEEPKRVWETISKDHRGELNAKDALIATLFNYPDTTRFRIVLVCVESN